MQDQAARTGKSRGSGLKACTGRQAPWGCVVVGPLQSQNLCTDLLFVQVNTSDHCSCISCLLTRCGSCCQGMQGFSPIAPACPNILKFNEAIVSSRHDLSAAETLTLYLWRVVMEIHGAAVREDAGRTCFDYLNVLTDPTLQAYCTLITGRVQLGCATTARWMNIRTLQKETWPTPNRCFHGIASAGLSLGFGLPPFGQNLKPTSDSWINGTPYTTPHTPHTHSLENLLP